MQYVRIHTKAEKLLNFLSNFTQCEPPSFIAGGLKYLNNHRLEDAQDFLVKMGRGNPYRGIVY